MIVGDNPIENPEEDAIGRISDAQNFVQHVLALDAKKGIVVGVLGPWGSGKTSFINLARNEFEKAEVPILDFNPWMFSGDRGACLICLPDGPSLMPLLAFWNR